MATVDTHDQPLSTDSETAAGAYRAGVTALQAAWPGADAALDAAITADPDFALAHAARSRAHLMRSEGEAARARMADAERLVAVRGDERERSHVAILAELIAGRPAEGLRHVYEHAERWPRDTVILGLPLGAFGLLAFSGMADHDQARVDLCERHAGHFAENDWWFGATRGWALAENGDVARGRAMLERSLDVRRQNANGVHALAHAMFEAGAAADADTLIADWLPGYDRGGILHGHLAWHAALNALQRGDAERALEIYAASVGPGVSAGMPINIVTDAASLLWRVEAYGHAAPAGAWDTAAAYARKAFPRPGHAFVDAHMALIEAATGDAAGLEQRAAALDAMAAVGKLGAGPVVPALARAAQAFADEDFAACARTLESMAGDVARIGGSGAQRELFEDMLTLALIGAGEPAKAAARLDRRLARKPTPIARRWREDAAA